ncbi:MAG: CHASE2 domain-containing protein [Sphingomonadales bacterium]|jgi:CHASE2 domain-containing sensor protein/signal transduction histidine kinase|nr:CHASE2 domain-containing protein [Sphingomonadales bacterium]
MLGALRLRLLLEWFAIFIMASFVVVAASYWRGASAFDNLFYDQLSAFGRPSADTEILMVTIDEHSLAEIGKWPWPRDIHARAVQTIQQGKPRSILFDILLSEDGDPAGDAALAAAFSAGSPAYLPLHFSTPGNEGRAYDTIPPAPNFAKTVDGIGHVNVEFDGDGIVRRGMLCFDPEDNGRRWPHITELVYRTSGKAMSPAYRRNGNCNQSVLIPYSKRGAFSEVAYADILNGSVPADLIQGRDVIIGATATGLGDNYPVPFGDGGMLSGSEIMANMLGALRRDDFIRPLGTTKSLLLSFLPVWILLIGFLRWRPRVALIASVFLVAVILIGSATALRFNWWFPPGAALLGILFAYPLWGWRRLQAMSDFMASELGDLESEGGMVPIPRTEAATNDLVGRQSTALAGAIDHLRDLRRFVSDTLEHLPDPMFVTDNDGVVTLANDLIEATLERPIVGMELNDLLDDIVVPHERASVSHYLAKRKNYADDPVDPKSEIEFVRFSSKLDRNFVMRTAAIVSDAGEQSGQIHYLADITELSRAQSDREEALQLLSHDMRAPQSAIISLLGDVRNERISKRIEHHARRTMQLAQDFVQIARMGEAEFSGTDILLVDLVRDMADSLWPLARERNIQIEVQDDCDDGFVFAEADTLTRAITNLLDNAIKHSPDGGKIIVTVSRLTDDSNPMLEVTIKDSGSGIDENLLPQLFGRFVTGREGKTRAKGLGLGLAFVKAVADRHGGTVTAKNAEDGGALFQLTLPEAVEPVED